MKNKKYRISISYIILFLFSFTACQKEISNDQSIVPPPVINSILIKTTVPFSITSINAISGGNITGNVIDSVVERGICFNIAPSPTVLNQKIIGGSGTGNFNCNLTGLIPNTTYYVRAFAKVNNNVQYGNEVSFNTLSLSNPISTDTASLIFLSGGFSKKLFALHAKDGSLKWTVNLPDKVTSSPIYSKGKVFVGCWDNKVYAFDTLGSVLWATPVIGNIYNYSPIVQNDIIYISTSLATVALNANNGTILWNFNLPRVGSLPIFRNNTIYVNSDSLYAIDALTGNKRWSYKTDHNTQVPPVITGNRIYVLSYNYTLSALNAATGAEIWKKPDYYLPISDCEGLNVKHGNIYVESDDLLILDSATGDRKYSTPIFAHLYTVLEYGDGIAPLVTDSLVFTMTGRIGVYDAFNGTYKYTLPIVNAFNYGVTIVGNIVYYTSALSDVIIPGGGGGTYRAGFAFAFDLNTRTLKWKTEFKDIDFTGPSPCAVSRSGKSYRGELSNN